MLNHFNFKKFDDRVLITNDFGKYAFLTPDEFRFLLIEKLDKESALYQELLNRGFIIESYADLLSDGYRQNLREMKSYLFEGTSLFIFALTNACNLNCIYCQARDEKRIVRKFMSPEVARKAVDVALGSSQHRITFEFQGGEPLLNFDAIRTIIEYTDRVKGDKQVEYTMVSNLVALTDEKLNFLREHHVAVSTSLDGPEILHNRNRRYNVREGSFGFARNGLRKLQQNGISAGAIETTTRYSLPWAREIVNTYFECDIPGIFLRPLTPLGFAREEWEEIGYSPDEYIAFYKTAFEAILEINRQGHYFPELLASYFLRKILNGVSDNYMELRSPCGAGLGQMAFYYDGNVYTCDEGRMVAEAGDLAFKIGTVDDSYDKLVQNPVCCATSVSSLVESLPSCSDCVYQPYCGVCPVVNYAISGDVFTQGSYSFRCEVYRKIQDYLFEILKNRPNDVKILESWVR